MHLKRKIKYLALAILFYIFFINNTVVAFNKNDITSDDDSLKDTMIGYNDLKNSNDLYCVDWNGKLNYDEDTYFMGEKISIKVSTGIRRDYYIVKFKTTTGIWGSSVSLQKVEKQSFDKGPIYFLGDENYLKMKYILSGSSDSIYGKGYSNGDGSDNYSDRQRAVWKMWNDFCTSLGNPSFVDMVAGMSEEIRSREEYNKGIENNKAPETEGSKNLLEEAEIYANGVSGRGSEDAYLSTAGTVKVDDLRNVPIKINSYTGVITGIYAYNGNDIVGKVDLNNVNIQNGSTINVTANQDITNIKVVVASVKSSRVGIYILQNQTNYAYENENHTTKCGQRLIYVEANNEDKVYTIDVERDKKTITINKKDSDEQPLSNVYFVLAESVKYKDGKWRYTYNSNYGSRKPTVNGKVTFDNLDPNKQYALFEEVPTGYSSKLSDIKVNCNGSRWTAENYSGRAYCRNNSEDIITKPCIDNDISLSENREYTITNKKATYNIKITKKDGDKVLPGIYFDLFYISNTTYSNKTEAELQTLLNKADNIDKILTQRIGTQCTNKNGVIEFKDLQNYGTYILRETNNEDKTNSYTYSKQGDTQGYSMNIGKIMKIDVGKEEYNCQRTMYNPGYGGLKIKKIDNLNNALKKEVVFKLYQYNGNTHKLEYKYTLKTNANGIATLQTTTTQYGVSYTTNYCIRKGEYYLFEYSNKNEGYNIKYQGQKSLPGGLGYGEVYYVPGIGAYIDKVNIETGKINTNPIEVANEPFVSIHIAKTAEKINNAGDLERDALKGAKFRLRKGNEWVTLRKATEAGNITEFVTDENGNLAIERVPVNATYTVYETAFPDDVDPTIQPGYDPNLQAVKIATIKVEKDGTIYDTTYTLKAKNDANDGVQLVEDQAKIEKISYRRKRVYEKTLNENGNGKEAKVYLYIVNHKYINISGYVWEDIGADTKNPGIGNNKYKDATTEKDKKIQGIQVQLYKKGSGNAIESTTTDSKGNYKFNSLLSSTGVKNGDYYIRFDYESYAQKEEKLYKPVTPIIDKSNSSKALTEIVLPEEDEKIIYIAQTGYGEDENGNEQKKYNSISRLYELFAQKNNGLKASDWIYKDTGDTIFTLHNINLGIAEMKKPEFTISQNISKAILNVNGYEYTYVYGEKGKATNYKETDIVKPTVEWQGKTDISAFTQKIYPSCIPTDSNKVNTTLKIVYEIVITNTTNIDILGYYKEHELIIKQWDLKDEWDSDRYELSTQSKDEGWIRQGTSYAKYNKEIIINNSGTKEKKLYITFDVKQDAIKELLNHPNGIVEKHPTKATATARHKYTRYDYGWKREEEDKAISRSTWRYWALDNVNKNGVTEDNREGKTHLSVPETQSDSAPYLALQVNKDNTISGVAFKDTNTRALRNEVVGDGIYQDSGRDKEKVISGVKVELLENDKKTNAKRYILKKKNETEYETAETTDSVTTNENGQYEFKGIVPGEYYIRFTYGNGEQIIVGENKQVTSNEFKSTIVEDQGAQLAFNGKGVDNNTITSDKGGYNWYLYNKNTRKNTAVDGTVTNKDKNGNDILDCFEKTKTIDYRTTTTTNNTKTDKLSITPQISVPIEFTTNKQGDWNSYNDSYNNMNFGIIEKPKLDIKIRKEITNIKVTLQNGQVLINGNPTQNIAYTANLDNEWPTQKNGKIGSNNVKIETDDRYLYGSTLEIRYTLTIENESDVTYLTEDYYKYGKYPDNKSANEATVAINSLIEYIDPNLKIKVYSDLKDGSSDQEYTYSDTLEPKKYEIGNLKQNNASQNAYRLTKDNLYDKYSVSKDYYKTLYAIGDDRNIINGKELTSKHGEKEDNSKTDLKVVAQRIISGENDNMEYIGYSQVSKVTTSINAYSDPTAAPFETEIRAYSEIPTDSAKIRATTSTGLDRSMKHVISATILLIGIAGVIVCVKMIRK